MNASRQLTEDLVTAISTGVGTSPAAEVIICPPSLYIAQAVVLAGSNAVISIGAQNLDYHDAGAFTGEVSAAMLSDSGCKYVIVGHSERRALFAETDDQVARKVEAAQNRGLIPIFCVGESLQERQSGQTHVVVNRQLDAVIQRSGIHSFTNLVLAYEPVWAIGTGKTATPEQAQDVHAGLRERLKGHDEEIGNRIRILYGGSVNAGNAADLFARQDIDGGLIGGASLDADSFVSICQAV